MFKDRTDEKLASYACGPGGHDYAHLGIRGAPFAVTVSGSTNLAESFTDELLQCVSCGKTRWSQTPTCDICDEYGESLQTYSPGSRLARNDGRIVVTPHLCPSCHLGVLDAAGGWCILPGDDGSL